MWGALVGVGVSLLTNYLDSKENNANTELQNLVDERNAEMENRMRESNNRIAGARGALEAWSKGRRNRYKLRNGQEVHAAIATNYLRAADAGAAGRVEQAIGAAEQIGGQISAAAAAGVLGPASDAVSATTRLRYARAAKFTEHLSGLKQHDVAQRAAAVWDQTMTSLDLTQVLPTLDRGVSTANKRNGQSMSDVVMNTAMQTNWGSVFDSLGGWGKSRPIVAQVQEPEPRPVDPTPYQFIGPPEDGAYIPQTFRFSNASDIQETRL